MTEDFQAFWNRYPRHVGKLAALKAYQRALSLALPEEILAGVEEYRKHLPEEARFIPHAATWLNQGRWMDDYTPVKVEPKRSALPTVEELRARWKKQEAS